eukprot:TRINITY_DN1629_c0_g1_i5.p1 TRINITY_DN1629_c0_g1~~TRINITY_DN1629_c0_g1_i5.p1  ORF type:complete len:377 (-),score=55.43 TRINITY_DN1629_c0_g1_i5:30-1160(-)
MVDCKNSMYYVFLLTLCTSIYFLYFVTSIEKTNLPPVIYKVIEKECPKDPNCEMCETPSCICPEKEEPAEEKECPPTQQPPSTKTEITINNEMTPPKEIHTFPLSICDIAFGIMIRGAQDARVKHIESSWLKRVCPQSNDSAVILVGTRGDDGFTADKWRILPAPASCKEDILKGLCCKVRFLWSELKNRYPNKKWYFRADDDTFVIPEMLRRYLSQLDPDKPYYIGDVMYMQDKDPRSHGRSIPWSEPPERDLRYANGGGGIVLSRGLMKKIHSFQRIEDICARSWPYEDAALGIMLRDDHNVHLTWAQGFFSIPSPWMREKGYTYDQRKSPPITLHEKSTEIWKYYLDLFYSMIDSTFPLVDLENRNKKPPLPV